MPMNMDAATRTATNTNTWTCSFMTLSIGHKIEPPSAYEKGYTPLS